MLRSATAVLSVVTISVTAWCVVLGQRAEAQASDAVDACGASVISDDFAYVPPEVRRKRFLKVGGLEIRCGDGQSWGAVHVELKHDVPSWAEAATCIAKVVKRGQASSEEGHKTRYVYDFPSGRVIVAAGSVNGLVTAYPTGKGVPRKWSKCAVS